MTGTWLYVRSNIKHRSLWNLNVCGDRMITIVADVFAVYSVIGKYDPIVFSDVYDCYDNTAIDWLVEMFVLNM